MGYFEVHFQTTENELFSKIMVAEKNNLTLILQMVISKSKNGKPCKN